MEFIVKVLLYDSDSKFFYFFYFLLFTFYFFFSELLFTFYFFFSELLFTFYFFFSELLFTFSFTYVLFLVSTRTSNPIAFAIIVCEALFCLCRGTNIYNSFGV